MNAVEELEQVLTLDQARGLTDFDPTVTVDAASTQQLLDELLGRLEDDDSTTFMAHGRMPEFFSDSDA
jgi:hypothetical protein